MPKKPFSKTRPPQGAPDKPGLAARRKACELIEWVLIKKRPIDEALDLGTVLANDQDRALARQIASTTLRHYGWLESILAIKLEKGLPPGLPRLQAALITGAAQILFLDVPDHAAVDLAVALVDSDRKARGMTGLANAVLRAITRQKTDILASLDPLHNLNPWMRQSWVAAYGEETARAIAKACLIEPPLDITVKDHAASWAEKLGGTLTPTGSIRLVADRPVPAMAGFEEGGWWVQDAAAAIPTRLFPPLAGKSVADCCAAPGGKTAQLAAMGAIVTAFDRSERRLERLHDNMQRLGLEADIVTADATTIKGDFDHVLLDAPCSATGTLRGHPDVGLLKSREDVTQLAALQARLIDNAVAIVKPGGTIVYCTCSLEPEEGEEQMRAALKRHPSLSLSPIGPHEWPAIAEFVTKDGFLRILPCYWPHDNPRLSGLDGFFAARLRRNP